MRSASCATRQLGIADRQELRIAAQAQRAKHGGVFAKLPQIRDQRPIDDLAPRLPALIARAEPLNIIAAFGDRQHIGPRPDKVNPFCTRIEPWNPEDLHVSSSPEL